MIEGILHVCGVAGGFDHVGTQVVTGHDDEEWADFLAAICHHHGPDPWTCRELLDEVQQARLRPPYYSDGSRGRPKGLTVEDLPSEFTRVGMSGTHDVTVGARSPGRWMANRRGRWAGDFTVREAGSVQRAKRWRVEKYEMPQGGVEFSESGPEHYAWARAYAHAGPGRNELIKLTNSHTAAPPRDDGQRPAGARP